MNRRLRYKRIGLWCGIAFFFLFWLACIQLSGFVPPPSPMLSGEQLLAEYAKHSSGLGLAIVMAYWAACLLIPWSATVYSELATIEGGPHPIMSLTFFGAGVANAVAFFLPFVFWGAGVYRAERSPDLILMISDMAWLEFVMLYIPTAMQFVIIGMLGLNDKRAIPTFPRWFCLLCFWSALLLLPGGVVIYFKSGPFTWAGILGFWVPVTGFCSFWFCLVPLMFKAIRRQEAEMQGAPAR